MRETIWQYWSVLINADINVIKNKWQLYVGKPRIVRHDVLKRRIKKSNFIVDVDSEVTNQSPMCYEYKNVNNWHSIMTAYEW